LVVALGVATVLFAGGGALPPLGACLVLAVPLTLCMNRFVFFPNEVGLTAEAATLFTAIVAWRSESPVLGPMVLALLVGLLDGRHWERRAFVRMSYNSGSQALTVLATAAVFGPLTSVTGTSATGLLVAAVLAALVYVVVETTCGVVLVVLLGEPVPLALRQQLPANALAVPLAVFGAVVALVVTATGSWLPALVLVPTAFVPEVVAAGWRRTRWRCEVLIAVALGALSVTVLLDEVSTGTRVGGAVGIATLVGLLGADARPLRRRSVFPSAALVLAAAAGFASAPWLVGVCGVGVVVALVVQERRGDALWSVPLLLTAWTLAEVVDAVRLPAGLVTVVGITAIVAAVATWGALPWPSRVVGPWGAGRAGWFPVVALAILSATCVAAGAAAAASWVVVPTLLSARIALVAAGGALACAAATVRQWRFARDARRRDAGWLGLGAVPLVASVVSPAGDEAGLVVAAALVTLSVAVVVGLRCARSVQRAQDRVESPA
jgi:hypothetical protein